MAPDSSWICIACSLIQQDSEAQSFCGKFLTVCPTQLLNVFTQFVLQAGGIPAGRDSINSDSEKMRQAIILMWWGQHRVQSSRKLSCTAPLRRLGEMQEVAIFFSSILQKGEAADSAIQAPSVQGALSQRRHLCRHSDAGVGSRQATPALAVFG